jgi:hypothetical protein
MIGASSPLPELPLSRDERLRRVVILCSDFTRNFAYYRAAHKRREAWEAKPFWRTVSNNFLVQCILDWCKLFVDKKRVKKTAVFGEHHWKSIVSDPSAFEVALFRHMQFDALNLDGLTRKIGHYRNKFVAHIDTERVMHVPELTPAWRGVCLYHEYVLKYETESGDFWNLPNDLRHYSEFCMSEGQWVYQPM